LANDSDLDGDTISIQSFTQPTSGTVTQNPDGTLRYTPDDDFNGTDSFTYTITDGNGGTDTATVNLTVNPQNDPPVAVDDSKTTNEDVAVDIDVLANDSDLDGDTISIQSFTQPTSGTVTQNPDGTLKYTPDDDFNGTDSFTYTITDGNGGTDTATVTLAVTPDEVAVATLIPGDDTVYESALDGGSGLPEGVADLHADGFIDISAQQGDFAAIRIGGSTGSIITLAMLETLETDQVAIPVLLSDVEYGSMVLTSYDSATGRIGWRYTLESVVDNNDASEIPPGGVATDLQDITDFTVELSDDGVNWSDPVTAEIIVIDDSPVGSVDPGQTVTVSAPDNSQTSGEIFNWTTGADGFFSISGGNVSAVIDEAQTTESQVVVLLYDLNGVLVGQLTLSPDGEDQLEVYDRPGDVTAVDLSTSGAVAGGPDGSYVLTSAAGLTTEVTGNGLDVNPSKRGWAIKDNQIDSDEAITFSFSGTEVQAFQFTIQGMTGGGDKAAIIDVTVNFVGGTSQEISGIEVSDGYTFVSTAHAIGTASNIESVTITNAEAAPEKNAFRIDNVIATAVSTQDPADLTLDFTLNVTDNDGDTASQDFSITLRGSEDGDIVIETNAPIAIDLDDDGVEYLGREEGVVFTDQSTGESVNTAWVGPDDGLLVIDANNSGTIDESREYVFTEWSETAETDMEAIAEVFDTNQDGVLDAQDDQWDQFRVWQDKDSDGQTDQGELVSLDDLMIESIDLTYVADSQQGTAADGDVVIHGQSAVTYADGSTGVAEDVSFAISEADLLNTEELLLNEAAGDSVAAAPNADAATADSTPDLSGADVDLQSLLPKVDDNGNV